MSRRPTAAERVYRALLVVFPADLRRDAGDDMARLFGRRWADAPGRRARLALTYAALVDLVRHGLGSRWDDRPRRGLPGETASSGRVVMRLLLDLQFGWRAYLRTPASTLVALAAIALGIGANLTLFAYADALFFRPVAARDPGRLVSLFHAGVKGGGYSSFSLPDFIELRDRSRTLQGLAAWATIDLDLGRPSSERVPAQIVSGDYFDVLGVTADVGRVFHADEDRTPDAHPVVVLSHAYWRRRLDADPAVAGRTMVLNGRDFTVIGVAPESFRGLELASDPQMWVPLMMHRAALPAFRAFGKELFGNRGTHWLELTGRLAPGETMGRATDELRGIAAHQAADNPDTNRAWTIAVTDAQDGRLGPPVSRTVVRLTVLLLVVVGLVLAIVCANVANLLLARAVGRQREIAVRLAVGASRGHLMRQLLTESVLLAGVGGAAGVVLAIAGLAVLPSLDATGSLPGLVPRIDVRVLVCAVGLIALTGVVFGLAPAVQASAVSLVETLKPVGHPGGRSRHWPLRQTLVVLQVALTMVLLTGAALMVRTIWNLYAMPLGFDADDVWVAAVDLSQRSREADRVRAVQGDVLERVRGLPGVRAAALGFTTPFGGARMANDILWMPPNATGDRQRTNADMNVVGPEYFDVLGVPVLRGRAFEAADRDGAAEVAIVNRALADRLWPDAEALGQTVWSWSPDDRHRPLRVVGVVENGRYYRSWRGQTRPFLFVPLAQWPMNRMTLHVRGASLSAGAIRRALDAAAPDLPPDVPVTLKGAMAASMNVERTAARLLGAFSLLALTIAAIGTYSVVSFAVGRQARDIGIRIALGARRGRVLGDVVAEALKPLALGVAIGWGVALAGGRFVASLLFGVRPVDPSTYAAVAATLLAVCVLASLVPAWRATRTDPAETLRA